MDKVEKEDFREIDTGMYGNIAPYILEKACNCYEYYLFSKAYRAEDGTAYLRIFRGKSFEFRHPKQVYKNPFYGKTDTEVLSMIADKLKSFADRFAKEESLKGDWWNEQNSGQWTITPGPDGVSVKLLLSDLYKTYGMLKSLKIGFDRRIAGKKLTLADLRRREKAKAKAEAKAAAKYKKDLAEWRKIRRISTGMYGDKAYELLKLLCGHYYFKLLPKTMRELEMFVKVVRVENKRICLEVKRREFSIGFGRRRNPFFGKSNAEARAWLGNAVRLFAVRYAEDKLGRKIGKKQMNASNCDVVFGPADYSWLSDDIRVSDAYAVAAALKGVKPEDNDAAQVIGKPLTDEEIKEINDAKAKEDAKTEIKSQYAEAVRKMQFGYMEKIAAEADAIKKKFEKEIRGVDPSANLEINMYGGFFPFCGRACN